VNGRSGTGQRNDQRSVKHRVNPIVIARCVEQVADHPRQGDFKSRFALLLAELRKGATHRRAGNLHHSLERRVHRQDQKNRS
jgi:hypothetical protein